MIVRVGSKNGINRVRKTIDSIQKKTNVPDDRSLLWESSAPCPMLQHSGPTLHRQICGTFHGPSDVLPEGQNGLYTSEVLLGRCDAK